MMIIRLAIFLSILCTQPVHVAPARVLTDMAGNAVTLPERVERIATVGPVPVLNSLVFAVGEGKRIVNGLPLWAKSPRFSYQAVFAPNIATLATMDNYDHTPNMEALLYAAPDAVLTMDRACAESLRRSGLPAIYLVLRRPGDVKNAVSLLGQVFEKQQAAKRYSDFFDVTLAKIAGVLNRSTLARPRVLYFSPATLTQPHLVAEWWIRSAGGESVTDDGRNIESRSFNMEQLLAWDPDIMIVTSREQLVTLRSEARFAGLKAIRSGRILVVPCGAHTWGNRTAELPLTVLWAAEQFHPELFGNVDLVVEAQHFYRDIFGVSLSEAQIEEILAGGSREMPGAD